MKPFRCNLEAVRTLRQRQEQNAMEAYAQALATRDHAVQHLAQVEHELALGWLELRRRLTTGCSAGQAAQVHAYAGSVQERREVRARALEQAERQVNQSMQAMLTARRKRETVDSYLARQKRRYDAALVREEHKELDEVGTRRSLLNPIWNQAVEAVV